MRSFFFLLAQLVLVTLVYAFAYRAGYRSAQSKAISVVKKFADPVACLLDSLSESIDAAAEDEEKKKTPRKTATSPDSETHHKSNVDP